MILCGIDEAGRGPLAGPVTAAAVVLRLDDGEPEHEELLATLADSKTLSPRRRAAAAEQIRARAPLWAIGWASHLEIDRLNILYASHLAMRRALCVLAELRGAGADSASNLSCIVDGSVVPKLPYPARAVVKADATVPEVMAASILAKEARDAWMVRYHAVDPRYEFARHKGYPTELHRERLAHYGPCSIHRLSFKPLQMDLFADAP